MNPERMTALVEQHLKAEDAGDVDGAVAVYTDDVEHDVVGWPGGPVHGKDAAREFYRELTANFRSSSSSAKPVTRRDPSAAAGNAMAKPDKSPPV